MATEQLNSQLNQLLIKKLNAILSRKRREKNQLCEEMGLSTSVLYKRLSGQSHFTIGELAFLMNKYNFSFDEWAIGQSELIPITLPTLKKPIGSIEEYLFNLEMLFKKTEGLKNVEVHYAAKEVPIFYYFLDPLLGCFKMYLFARVLWDFPNLRNDTPFSMSLFSPSSLEQMKRLWDLYAALPSKEIWNPHVWDNTLHQIEYMLEINAFSSVKDAFQLVQTVHEISNKCETMCKASVKLKNDGQQGGALHLYNNRFLHHNNMVVVGNAEKKFTCITHDNPNFIMTEDQKLSAYTMNYFDKLLHHGHKIGPNEKQEAEDYFRNLKMRIHATGQTIHGFAQREKKVG